MIKKILVAMLSLFAAMAFAAVDANKASQAELEAVQGIGPAIAGKILDERKKASFKDWQDLVARVKGVGEGNAAKFSTAGLTVNGAAYAGAPAAKKDDKPAAKTDKPAAAAAAATPAAKADAKPAAMSADEKKAAAKKDKEEKKKAKAAADEEAKKAKADKAAAAKAGKAASAPASAPAKK